MTKPELKELLQQHHEALDILLNLHGDFTDEIHEKIAIIAKLEMELRPVWIDAEW